MVRVILRRRAPRNRLRRLLLGGAAVAAGAAVTRRRLDAGSFVSRRRLRDALQPHAGERLLELGPGSGHYAERAADWVWPGGRLDLVGAAEAELEPALARTRDLGLDNVVPAAAGDVLPWPDATFDGAYSVAAGAELLARDGMLDELHRVIRPGGRLVVADRSLRAPAEAAGFRVDRRSLLVARFAR